MAKENGKLPWLPLGGGEMGDSIRRFDWASSPLGPIEQWPTSLRTAAQIMLSSRYPMFVWWGPELINLYNDSYIPLLGSRHPSALGASAPKLWSDTWHDLGPLARKVREQGKATWNERALLLMERHGFREETYFTFSYSPAPDDYGGIGGVFCACSEETSQVVAERRLLALRQLSSATAEAKSEQEVCQIAANILARHPYDVAFALIYRLQANGTVVTLAAAGLAPGEVSDGFALWPFHTVLPGQRVVINPLQAEDLPSGVWAEPCHTAVVLPLVKGGQEKPTEFLVAGVSPLRPFDDHYQGFFDLLATGLAAAITNARVRRQAAEDLRISREQLARQVSNFETLLREIPVGIAVATDPYCRDIQSNPEFARMLGIAPDENASKSGANPGFLVVREGREVPVDELPMQLAAQQGREVRDFEADIVRSDGTTVRELMHAVPLFDESGAVRGSLAVAVDITERRRADEALRESEQRFRNMAESAPVMIWVTDPAGCCTYINRQWLEFTGTTLEQNLGLGWTNAAHPDDRGKAVEAFLMANRQRKPFRVEYRLGRRDGQWRWAVDSAAPRFAADGSFLGFIGSVIDITERREMEQALQASEEQLALAQEAAGVGSWNWHPTTGAASFSGEYFSLHGLPRDRGPLSYEEWLSLVHPEDRARVHAEMQDALTESYSLDTEFRVVHPDGRIRWLAGKGTVFCDDEGRAARFTGVLYDVTVRKEAERELVRSNEDLKQFAYAASHDLQEPLRVVINYTQLLERRYKAQLDGTAGKIIDTAVDSALRMERLLRGLRDYWQVSERQSAPVERIDLDDVLEKALLNVQDAVVETGGVIRSTSLPQVYAAETPMIQVFQNLLSNALKYRSSERNPEISIGAEQHPNEWVISVTDNGLGIDDQYVDQIFGIFKRLHGPEYSGAGIGLSICHKIIERMGGRIWVESQPGRGSTFRFSLPKRY